MTETPCGVRRVVYLQIINLLTNQTTYPINQLSIAYVIEHLQIFINNQHEKNIFKDLKRKTNNQHTLFYIVIFLVFGLLAMKNQDSSLNCLILLLSSIILVCLAR